MSSSLLTSELPPPLGEALPPASAASSAAGSVARDRFASVRAVYDAATFDAIQTARVLVVGAGGIGCELLKNLVLTGFQDITLLDLDTIDVSNLNRQFLFRRESVGKSKAVVARETVLRWQPTANITAIHGNIKEEQYDHDWFNQFTLVMNALDNLEARRHVNRLCISAGRTLLESGTQGYTGQSLVIRGGVTECFECNPTPTPMTFAVCTIRNTPDKPVHTIVWAKALYAALFGPEEEGNIMSDAKMDLGEGVKEAQAKADAWKTGSVDAFAVESYSGFAAAVFTKLYKEEILKQCEVKDRWKDRAPPTPLDLSSLLSSARATGGNITPEEYRRRDQVVLSTAENAVYFLRVIDATLATRAEQLGELTFDKDDELSMDFVALAASLRMSNFSISPQSRFALKGVAGNIVHAIATTNAIAAGMMVVDAIKVLQNRFEACNTSWIARGQPHLISSQKLAKPNPKCYVCSQHTLELTLNTNKWNLKRLYEDVLGKKLSMNEPSVNVLNRENFIGTLDDHTEDNPDYLLLPLSAPGVRVDHGALLSVDDQSQQLTVQLRIKHREEWKEEEEADEYVLTGELAAATTDLQSSQTGEESKEETATTDLAAKACAIVQPAPSPLPVDDDDIVMSDSAPSAAAAQTSTVGTKRKSSDDADEMTTAKKLKVAQAEAATENSDGVIELD